MDMDDWVADNSDTLSVRDRIKRGLSLPPVLYTYDIAYARYPDDGRLRIGFEDALNAAIAAGELAATPHVATGRRPAHYSYGGTFVPAKTTQQTSYAVHKDDYRRWLESKGWPLPDWWFPSDDAEPPVPDDPGVTVPHNPGPRERQLQALIDAIVAKKWNPLAIPYRGKKILQDELCKDQPALFTPASFIDAWKEARKHELVRMADHEKYAKR